MVFLKSSSGIFIVTILYLQIWTNSNCIFKTFPTSGNTASYYFWFSIIAFLAFLVHPIAAFSLRCQYPFPCSSVRIPRPPRSVKFLSLPVLSYPVFYQLLVFQLWFLRRCSLSFIFLETTSSWNSRLMNLWYTPQLCVDVCSHSNYQSPRELCDYLNRKAWPT